MYADEIGISVNSGLYFTFMAIGLAVSRMFSGRQVEQRRITLVISLGMYLAAASFFGLAALERLMQWNSVSLLICISGSPFHKESHSVRCSQLSTHCS